eukprot:834653-Prorocentrum_minimum.AAC.1
MYSPLIHRLGLDPTVSDAGDRGGLLAGVAALPGAEPAPDPHGRAGTGHLAAPRARLPEGLLRPLAARLHHRLPRRSVLHRRHRLHHGE